MSALATFANKHPISYVRRKDRRLASLGSTLIAGETADDYQAFYNSLPIGRI
jgi:hypothetical protein